MRHLREHTKQKLIDDSINKQDRDSILDIFGNDGFGSADDSIGFNEKSTVLEEKSKGFSSKSYIYYQRKLKTNIKEKVLQVLLLNLGMFVITKLYNINLCVVYLPPKQATLQNFKTLFEKITPNVSLHSPTIILGDFNQDSSQSSSIANHLNINFQYTPCYS